MQHAKPLLLLAALLGSLGPAGCASPGLTEGRKMISGGATEAGLERLKVGLQEEPDNIELRSYYYSQREKLASQLLTQAQQDIDKANFDAAEATLKQVIAIDPENPRAKALLANLGNARAHQRMLEEGRLALANNQPALAESNARAVLTQSSSHAGAIDLLRQSQVARAQEEVALRDLGAAGRKTVTLEFRDTPLRNVFDMISRQSSINFIFDKDVRLDTKATLFARNTTVNDAISMLLSTGGLAKKLMNPTTLLVYPDTPQKQKQYQELMVKSFYLGNADAKSTMAMLRVLIKAKDMYVDERLNQLVMRDTADTIRLAEKIIAVQDVAEPEVMLKVEVLEVKRSLLLNLGVQYPNQFTLINPGVATALTLENLKNASSSTIAISPAPAVNVKQDDSDVNILANPRIRVKNREKAKIHIGDKLPVITSNVTSTGVISESVAYLDTGLKLDVEPSIQMRDEVQIRVNLEVSNIVKEVRSTGGTLTYQLGTRNATTVMRLKDGETQVLAGLIGDEERSSSSGIPGLANLPILGRLFANKSDEHIKTEIVMLITPYILRNAQAPQPAVTEFRAGTENAIGGSGGTTQAPLNSAPIQPENLPAPEIPPANLPPDANLNAILPAPDAVPAETLTPEELQKLDSVSPVFPTQ